MNINIICQKTKKIEIETDSNILPLLKTKSNDKILTISADKPLKPRNPINVYIYVPNLKRVNLSGSLKVNITNVKSDSFEAISGGASNLNVSGQTKDVGLMVTGAGYIDTKNLKAENVKVNMSGASLVDVFATNQLDAEISGFGKINYYGSPKKVNKKISGMGVISERK